MNGIKASLLIIRDPWLRGTWFVGFLIAIFSPSDVLGAYPVLSHFVNGLNGVFPIIGAYMRESRFPGVTGLYFSVMISFGPIWFYRFASNKNYCITDKANEIFLHGSRTKKIVLCVFMTLIAMSLVSYLVLFEKSGYDFHVLPINSSRLSLSIFGFLFNASSFACLAFIGSWIHCCLKSFRKD